MSNHLAIATVTATLQRVLSVSVAADVTGSEVKTVQPNQQIGTSQNPMVTIFLHNVVQNKGMVDIDTPTRDGKGELVNRPRIALDLFYLLSFYGDEGTLQPQRLLGSVVRTLNSRPFLTKKEIHDTLSHDSYSPFIGDSDLAEAIEDVKFELLKLELEDMTKLWSTFFQVPYSLSVAYKVSVVVIDALDAPQAGLPVQDRNFYFHYPGRPEIIDILPDNVEPKEIEFGDTINILGRNLIGDRTTVLVGGVEIIPNDVRKNKITLVLTNQALKAGIRPVQVVHEMMMGKPPSPHNISMSEAKIISLLPKLTNKEILNPAGTGDDPRSATIKITVKPFLRKGQRAFLLLSQLSTPNPESYIFEGPRPTQDSDTISFQVSGLKPSKYLLRIQVDGANSVLEIDTDETSPSYHQFTGPEVEIQ